MKDLEDVVPVVQRLSDPHPQRGYASWLFYQDGPIAKNQISVKIYRG
jgi:hypothetical protein